ncbi:hypothetical protein [Mesorhizobium silamurunense]|uniref:hypothetical protein n=1 Tax=Mesorhizobium silamurunense TaxID=499528 RepID=UPI00177B5E19|nr:hypothetical protein [Mesorhizobium silamurunense]
MWDYRDYLRSINRPLAEEYIRKKSHHVSSAIEVLANGVPVALAIAQLHEAIRRSAARNFWPVIRETKGLLLVRSTDTGQEYPWPWARTKRGNMRFKLPGHLIFSPWLPNFHRALRSHMTWLQRVAGHVKALENKDYFSITHLPHWIWDATLGAKHIIPEIQAFQGFAMPDSIAALDRWSDEPQRGSNIVLRISRGTLCLRRRLGSLRDRNSRRVQQASPGPINA